MSIMKHTLVLAIDIGNTNTHVGLVDCETLACLNPNGFPTKNVGRCLAGFLESLVNNKKDAANLPVVICSVVNTIKDEIPRVLSSAGFKKALWLEHGKRFPVSVTYENVQTLGADRLADCLYGFAAYPGKSQIIINAGTAITVDFLKNGHEFCGGTIVPGLFTQLKSLHDSTSNLPAVELDETAAEFPGTSTKSSMTAGVTFGTAGALSFLAARYREQFGDAIVLATGGSWKHVEKLVTFEYTYVPEMTVIGTGLYWRYCGDLK